jgi:hypothetical protein
MNDIVPSGQIIPGSPFGDALVRLGSDSRYKKFIETGTWNGRGSTLCFAKGIHSRTDKDGVSLVSIESNRQMYGEALKVWANYPFVSIQYGHIAQSMMTQKEIVEHPLFRSISGHYYIHYGSELEGFRNTPFLKFEGDVDVALIDGGEFTGHGDYIAIMKMNPKVICLDDTSVIKTSGVLKELIETGTWNILSQGRDRNGWCILTRKE